MKKKSNKASRPNVEDTMPRQYDFSDAARGVTAARYAEGANIELGSSSDFWKLITKRHGERTITRPELEGKIRKAKTQPASAQQDAAAGADTRKKRSRRHR